MELLHINQDAKHMNCVLKRKLTRRPDDLIRSLAVDNIMGRC
nr:MAG TPA: hypothetical protein [Caudoviricetes sp.]